LIKEIAGKAPRVKHAFLPVIFLGESIFQVCEDKAKKAKIWRTHLSRIRNSNF
jgi:hypothetical protein